VNALTRFADLVVQGRRWFTVANVEEVRSALVKISLIFTCLAGLNGVSGSILALCRPEGALTVRLTYAAWVLLHPGLWLLQRRRPQLARWLYLISLQVVLIPNLYYLRLPGLQVLSTGVIYHCSILALAASVLDLRPYLLYASLTTAGQFGHLLWRVPLEQIDVLTGFATPLIGMWVLTVAVNALGERNLRQLSASRRELEQHKLHLEEEVQARTRVIQEQQARLLQDEKLRVMGQLAGGIAHDFNNLLSGILGHTELLKSGLRPDSDEARAVEVIGQAARRGSELTRQLLDYARPDRHRSGPIDLHRLIEEVLALLARPLGGRVRLERCLHPEALFLEGEPGELHEALVNLTLNARDAMPDGGVLSFETSREVGGSPGGPPGSAPGTEFARVTVRDTGCGIPPELLPKVFEPFVTTKANGTGMGLAMVRRVIDRCGGVLQLETAPGRGTAFHLFFPLAQAPRAGAEPPTPAGPVRGSGCVLLVDDEETVLQVEGSMLEHLGYTVVPASSPLEALELFRAGKERIDAVILDQRLPHLSGLECLRALREIAPRVPVVLVSGSHDPLLEQAQADGEAVVLFKPISIRELGQALGRVLGGGSPP